MAPKRRRSPTPSRGRGRHTRLRRRTPSPPVESSPSMLQSPSPFVVNPRAVDDVNGNKPHASSPAKGDTLEPEESAEEREVAVLSGSSTGSDKGELEEETEESSHQRMSVTRETIQPAHGGNDDEHSGEEREVVVLSASSSSPGSPPAKKPSQEPEEPEVTQSAGFLFSDIIRRSKKVTDKTSRPHTPTIVTLEPTWEPPSIHPSERFTILAHSDPSPSPVYEMKLRTKWEVIDIIPHLQQKVWKHHDRRVIEVSPAWNGNAIKAVLDLATEWLERKKRDRGIQERQEAQGQGDDAEAQLLKDEASARRQRRRDKMKRLYGIEESSETESDSEGMGRMPIPKHSKKIQRGSPAAPDDETLVEDEIRKDVDIYLLLTTTRFGELRGSSNYIQEQITTSFSHICWGLSQPVRIYDWPANGEYCRAARIRSLRTVLVKLAPNDRLRGEVLDGLVSMWDYYRDEVFTDPMLPRLYHPTVQEIFHRCRDLQLLLWMKKRNYSGIDFNKLERKKYICETVRRDPRYYGWHINPNQAIVDFQAHRQNYPQEVEDMNAREARRQRELKIPSLARDRISQRVKQWEQERQTRRQLRQQSGVPDNDDSDDPDDPDDGDEFGRQPWIRHLKQTLREERQAAIVRRRRAEERRAAEPPKQSPQEPLTARQRQKRRLERAGRSRARAIRRDYHRRLREEQWARGKDPAGRAGAAPSSTPRTLDIPDRNTQNRLDALNITPNSLLDMLDACGVDYRNIPEFYSGIPLANILGAAYSYQDTRGSDYSEWRIDILNKVAADLEDLVVPDYDIPLEIQAVIDKAAGGDPNAKKMLLRRVAAYYGRGNQQEAKRLSTGNWETDAVWNGVFEYLDSILEEYYPEGFEYGEDEEDMYTSLEEDEEEGGEKGEGGEPGGEGEAEEAEEMEEIEDGGEGGGE